jgi:uncharacterized protein
MFSRVIMAVSLLVLTSAAGAQTQASPANASPSKEEVMKFLEVTQTRSRIVQIFEGMAQQARLSAEQGLKDKVPDATPEQLARADALADTLFKEFSPDEMIDAIVPIYQKHFSKSDLDGILAFYASPPGQKILKETPAIMSASMQAGGEIGRRKMGAINQKIETQITDMAREAQSKKEKEQKPQPAKN